jgi:small subunit ribosomal protein S1
MESTEEQQTAPVSAGESVTAEELGYEEMVSLYDESMRNLKEGDIVQGSVIEITANSVVIDVGYKSEGLVPLEEFTSYDGELTVEVGDEVEVLLEKTEDREGHVLLSKRKAEKMRVWSDVEKSYKAGETIQGRVIDRIKGGLTVDVGIRAFLPGSLVDIKPVKNLESLKGRELDFKVISMDRRRNNVVLSRKAVLEKEFAQKKAETLTLLREGAVLDGVVKNITDYGVFIDLGGIDGLLHITDISWGRVNHPSEYFSVGDETQVVILKFDPSTERVSLGYKQRSEDPWTLVDKKYPLGSRVHGKVVSLVDYGAFVELEEGVEGLIHVSEMSWTKKVVNPTRVVNVGDEVQAIVSELDLDQRRISLSLRQAERNPWEELAITHPVGSVIEGQVRNLTEFGAFVQITEEIDGLIHVSDMSWTKRVKHPSEVLQKGDSLQARITNIDVENQRVSLSIKEFLPNEWENFVNDNRVGDSVTGRVVNVTDFGIFVDIFEGLEGLVHVSEIDVESGKLQDHYSLGDWVSARILRIEDEEKKVGLTMRGVEQPEEAEVAELEAAFQERQAAVAAEAEAAHAADGGDEGSGQEEGDEPAAEAAEVEVAADEAEETVEEAEPELEAADAEETEAADAESEEAETVEVEAEAAEAEEPEAEEVQEAAGEDAEAEAEEAEEVQEAAGEEVEAEAEEAEEVQEAAGEEAEAEAEAEAEEADEADANTDEETEKGS